MSAFLTVLGWKLVFYTGVLVAVFLRLLVVSRRNARLREEVAREAEARAKAQAEADTLHAELVRRQEELTARQEAAAQAQEQAAADARAVPDGLTTPELVDRLRELP